MAIAFSSSALRGTNPVPPTYSFPAVLRPPLLGTDAVAPRCSIPAVLRDMDPPFPNYSFPAWVLLDQEAQIDEEDCGNETTTAEARTSSGRLVKVSFFAAEPPYLSHFRVHCPGLTERFDFLGKPCILHSVDDLTLISVTFGCGSKTEYFFYHAGRGCRPSLEHLPGISNYLKGIQFLASVGFLPRSSDANGGGFVLAALGFTSVAGQYELHVFQSEWGAWTKNVLTVGNRKLSNVDKVIAIGAGELAFIDLLKGILICDVLREKPEFRLIVLPKLLPHNQDRLEARLFRDVVVFKDGLKCVELEAQWQRVIHERKVAEDVSIADSFEEDMDEEDMEEDDMEEEIYEYLGWRFKVWSRTLSSTGWHKEYVVHDHDITVSPIHTAFLHEFGSVATLEKLFMSVPTLGINDDSSLYMISKAKQMDEEFCVLMFDIKKKTLEDVSSAIAQRTPFSKPNYIPCSMSRFLNSDSDGQNMPWSIPSLVEPAEENDNLYITPRDYKPCTQYYYDPTAEPHPLLRPPSMPLGAGLTRRENVVPLEGVVQTRRENVLPLEGAVQGAHDRMGKSFWSTTEEDSAGVPEAWMEAYTTKPRSAACIKVGY